jgi:hypothetical protein
MLYAAMATNVIAMQVDKENSSSETNRPHVSKKRKQPEPTDIPQPTDLAESPLPFGATSIPDKVPFLGNLYCFQLIESKWTNSSTFVVGYQLFGPNQDRTAYVPGNFITLTLKNLDQFPPSITLHCKRQDPNDLNLLENHEWDALPKTYDKFDEIITKELSKEFYILCCINPIETKKKLVCCNPKDDSPNSYLLANKILTIHSLFVILKCGHYFHPRCLPKNFRKIQFICPVPDCKMLIESPDDFFIYDKTLPQIRINAL